MTLTACPSCEGQVSVHAALCPKCGHQFKTPGSVNLKDPVHMDGLGVVVMFVIGVAGYILRIVWTAAV